MTEGEAPTYHSKDAATWIVSHTGENVETVSEFLEKHYGYRAQKGGVIDAHNDTAGTSEFRTVYVESVLMSVDDLTMEVACLKMHKQRVQS